MSDIIYLIRKWYWLVLLGAIIGGGGMFAFRQRQLPTYQAQAMLSVGNPLGSPNANILDFEAAEKLAQTYMILARSYTILEATVTAGDFPLTPEELASRLTVRLLPSTSLIVIEVNHSDPALATLIANELAHQLILRNRTSNPAVQLNSIDNQIQGLKQDLLIARHRLSVINEQINTSTDLEEIERLNARLNVTVAQINNASIAISQSVGSQSFPQVNSLAVLEAARTPLKPTGPGVLTYVLIGTLVGTLLSGGIAFLIEYLDNKVRVPQQAEELLQAPVLETIAHFKKRPRDYAGYLSIKRDVVDVEPYLKLRTKLLFLKETNQKSYMVLSAEPNAGASITAANLAVSIARSGIKVMLIDMNLQNPAIHKIFNLPNEVGWNELIHTDPSPLATSDEVERVLVEHTQKTSFSDLTLMTAGNTNSDHTKTLDGNYSQQWIKVLEASLTTQVLIIDAPSIYENTESLSLAGTSQIPIVVVVRAGRTSFPMLFDAKKQFDTFNVKVRGLILNDIKL